MFFFSKMQATGNDFVIINYLEEKFQYSFKLLSEFLCDRHYGVGADGVIIIDKSQKCDFKMRIFNKDGSEAEMCGNGIRCLAKYVYEKELIKEREFSIETMSGEKRVFLEVEGNTVLSICVDMGKPVLKFEEIPVNYISDDEEKGINIGEFTGYPISVGNPHLVIFIDDVENFNVKKYGSIFENYKYFPNKINIEFVEIINNEHIKVRVWERGVGETLACGTGACAAAYIFCRNKSTSKELTVDLLGGKLKINCLENIFMSGPAEFVFDGKINI